MHDPDGEVLGQACNCLWPKYLNCLVSLGSWSYDDDKSDHIQGAQNSPVQFSSTLPVIYLEFYELVALS